MRYLSLFSGVEAASVAWMRYGWKPLAFAEIDAFPSAVLSQRFPDVPNLGDVCKVDWKEVYGKYGAVDVLVGGSPCQSFSIAGGRSGLQGESGLMFEYIRAIRDLVHASKGKYPRYIIWENVPGALSSERGNAFGQLLAELDELGYGLAWRVFDAQFVRVPDGSPGGFFGPVAQRRRRVFLVGVLGSPHAAEILFERESLRGDNPTSREARKSLAGDSQEGFGAGYCKGFKFHQGSGAGNIGYGDVSPTLATDWHVPGIIQAKENGGYSLNYQNPVMLKVRCGSDTYEKPDGKIGTAGKGALMSEDVAFTIAASQDQTLIEPNEYVVRRLTPVECERLQGFPDGWTDLTGCDVDETTMKVAEALGYEEGSKEFKKLQRDVSKWSKDCPDTPRYKAMGNSIATACLMWIGRRVEAFDILHYDEVGL